MRFNISGSDAAEAVVFSVAAVGITSVFLGAVAYFYEPEEANDNDDEPQTHRYVDVEELPNRHLRKIRAIANYQDCGLPDGVDIAFCHAEVVQTAGVSSLMLAAAKDATLFPQGFGACIGAGYYILPDDAVTDLNLLLNAFSESNGSTLNPSHPAGVDPEWINALNPEWKNGNPQSDGFVSVDVGCDYKGYDPRSD